MTCNVTELHHSCVSNNFFERRQSRAQTGEIDCHTAPPNSEGGFRQCGENQIRSLLALALPLPSPCDP